MTHPTTWGQTIGPFFGYALPYAAGPDLVPVSHPDAIRLTGLVLDGHGDPIPDALIEIWQADPSGAIVQVPSALARDGWTFTGFGRSATDATGRYSFTTLTPGTTSDGRTPFIAVTVFARGLLDRLLTRAYLPDGDLDGDPLLASLPEQRRRTLLATRIGAELRFDIRLQGPDETVFLTFAADPVNPPA
jgi:protocatechuate 3,4-dioxygenase alpha subunit